MVVSSLHLHFYSFLLLLLLHSYSAVISNDKSSDIPNSFNSDFIKRSSSFQSVGISDSSSSSDDKPSNSSPTIGDPTSVPSDETQSTQKKESGGESGESKPVVGPEDQSTEEKPQDPAATVNKTDAASNPSLPAATVPDVHPDKAEDPKNPGPESNPEEETEVEEPLPPISDDPKKEQPNNVIQPKKEDVIPSHIDTANQITNTTIETTTEAPSDSSATILAVVLSILAIICIAIVVFFVCKRYRKKKGKGKGGKKGKKLKQTNVKVTKKKPEDGNSKASTKTAKSISEMKRNAMNKKGMTTDKSKTRSSSSSKSSGSGRNVAPFPTSSQQSIDSISHDTQFDPISSTAQIDEEQKIFVCYGDEWREVQRVDSDFSFSIGST